MRGRQAAGIVKIVQMHSGRFTTSLRWQAVRVAGALAVGVVSVTGCAKKVPVAQAPPPPLEVPVVPPRLVGPVVVEEPPVTTAEVPEPAPARPRPARPAPRPGNGGSEPVVRVDPPPESGKTPEPQGQPSNAGSSGNAAAAEPAPLLRTPDSADDTGVAKSVQETLTRAEQTLNKVNSNALNAGAKQQYDMARRFIGQAQEALKGRRLDFARYLANKADQLSASLLNR